MIFSDLMCNSSFFHTRLAIMDIEKLNINDYQEVLYSVWFNYRVRWPLGDACMHAYLHATATAGQTEGSGAPRRLLPTCWWAVFLLHHVRAVRCVIIVIVPARGMFMSCVLAQTYGGGCPLVFWVTSAKVLPRFRL